MQVMLLMLAGLAVVVSMAAVLEGHDGLDRKKRQTPSRLVIGAILESDDPVSELALKTGIEEANQYLSSSRTLAGVSLMASIRKIDRFDSFRASSEACQLMQQGVLAVVGPPSPVASQQVRSVCEHLAVPFIETAWHHRGGGGGGGLEGDNEGPYSVNLNPDYRTFGRAILDYVRAIGDWDLAKNEGSHGGVAIVYKDPDTLLKFEPLLNAVQVPVLLRQWRRQAGTFQYVMKELRSAKVYKILVDIPTSEILRFVSIAKLMNMTTTYHSYIFTSWDAQRIDLSKYQLIKSANMSTLSLMPILRSNERYNVSQRVENMREEIFNVQSRRGNYSGNLTNMLPTQAATLFDSLILLAHGLERMANARSIQVQPLKCTAPRQNARGATLLNYMRSMSPESGFATLTGPVEFDAQWRRSNFTLVAYELTRAGFNQLGTWTQADGFKMTKTYSETQQEYQRNLRNKTLRVTTIADPPFVEIRRRDKNGRPLPHPSAWDGFCIEMLNLIADHLKFNYTVQLVKDNNYGAANGTDSQGRDTWNGMIGELINHEADLAVASLTITYEREKVIDFTTPFMSLGLSILFKKPAKKKPHLFSFLQPLSVHVWGYMLVAYITVSFVLFVVARFSPYEWRNPHPCNPDTEVLENQFSLINSLWFNIGSLMQQGSEISPRALSTRLVSGIWWFFTLIMISSYTANLAAFLTVERMQSPIESVEDLAGQNKIKYGTLSGGSTYQFFKLSKGIDVFKRMWDYMSKRPDVFVNKTEEGIARVKRGDYAFILESTWNEYYTQRNCDLMRVGGLLDSKGYGIGLPSGSPYRDMISESILMFQKSQDLENLRRRWWRQKNITVKCEDPKDKKAQPSGLSFDQVAGIYVVLIGGMLVAMVTVAGEFCYKSIRRADKDKQPIMTELWQELKLALRCCGGSRKRPADHLARKAQEAARQRAEAAQAAATAATAAAEEELDTRPLRQARRLAETASSSASLSQRCLLLPQQQQLAQQQQLQQQYYYSPQEITNGAYNGFDVGYHAPGGAVGGREAFA
ncbi:hypothetical protein BOX15_Mlig030089g10 [Macrostomum lignano]|uniref:Glutamate receptor ionotropic, kainate 2 n=2 Tax=Macrostomum lignano TaxID=282301 RepID=A0A267H3Q4_9PLAT|nr:hypothetical protein BOX15_Mlig030089g10 [Macrostomum lignano]